MVESDTRSAARNLKSDHAGGAGALEHGDVCSTRAGACARLFESVQRWLSTKCTAVSLRRRRRRARPVATHAVASVLHRAARAPVVPRLRHALHHAAQAVVHVEQLHLARAVEQQVVVPLPPSRRRAALSAPPQSLAQGAAGRARACSGSSFALSQSRFWRRDSMQYPRPPLGPRPSSRCTASSVTSSSMFTAHCRRHRRRGGARRQAGVCGGAAGGA